MRYFITTIIILLAGSFVTATAQSKEESRYRKKSEEVRQSVWAWDKPEFKVRTVPEEYARASKVIMAHHTELTADSKSKIVFTGLGFGSSKEQSITEIVREMVKLNDKSALDEYSELSFTQFVKNSGFLQSDKSTSFVGVRVIKPNGKITEIDADDIVLVKDESKVKKAKLAIPDLQPGDIIDYFIATERTFENALKANTYQLILFDNAPVLHLSFHGQLGKKFAVVYRSYNGAPDLKVDKNDDKDIIIDVVKKNMPPLETTLWIAPALQLPFIRMDISLGTAGRFAKRKKGEITKLTESDEGIEDKRSDLAILHAYHYGPAITRKQYKYLIDDARKFAKQTNTSFKDLTDKEKAALLFYTFRFTRMLNFNIEYLNEKIDIGNYNFNNNTIYLYCLLKSAGIEREILLSAYRMGIRMNEAMDGDAISAITYLPGKADILNLQNVYDIPFSIPSSIEGLTDTRTIDFGNKSDKDLGKGPKIPVSIADSNAHIENLKIVLAADNSNLSVRRSTTLKGLTKYDAQRRLILYEDLYEEERKAFNEKKSLIEKLEDAKTSRKYIDEVKNAFAEARKNQKDAFLEEAKYWFEQDITDIKNWKTETLGVRHTAPDFIYSSSFNMGGLVKKAGNNFIIEIGKIQGQPLVIKPEQRKRDLDIYMPYARSIEYNIEFAIPEGYIAEGLEALNKNVSNEAGFFITEAVANGKIITIKIKKHYLRNYLPASKWDKVIEFTDAAGDWTNSKILLKKI